MRRLLIFAALLIAFAAPVSAGQTLQAQTKAWSVTPDTRLRFEFPVGQLRVEATDDTRVRLELVVKCKSASSERCERFVRNLSLDVDHTASELRVKVEGYPKFATTRITLPANLPPGSNYRVRVVNIGSTPPLIGTVGTTALTVRTPPTLGITASHNTVCAGGAGAILTATATPTAGVIYPRHPLPLRSTYRR